MKKCKWKERNILIDFIEIHPRVLYSKNSPQTNQVFVRCCCVSCHCGHQSAVVDSRVWHFSRGDLQFKTSDISQNPHWQVVDTFRMFQPWFGDVLKELWLKMEILAIPLQWPDRPTVAAGENSTPSLCNMFLKVQWLDAVLQSFTYSTNTEVRTRVSVFRGRVYCSPQLCNRLYWIEI